MAYIDVAEDFYERLLPIEGPKIAVGYSMGGNAAGALACQHPELFIGLVLVSSGFSFEGCLPNKSGTQVFFCSGKQDTTSYLDSPLDLVVKHVSQFAMNAQELGYWTKVQLYEERHVPGPDALACISDALKGLGVDKQP